MGKAFLSELRGEKIVAIDSVNSGDGVYKFSLDTDKYHTGFYRLTINKNKWLDFIYDNEDLELETNADHILDSLKIIKSESNNIFSFHKLFKIPSSF